MLDAPCPLRRLGVAALVAMMTACGAQPSRAPLGVGPLPKGAKLAAELRADARRAALLRQRSSAGAKTAADSDGAESPKPALPVAPPAAVAKTDAHPVGAGGATSAVVPPDASGEYRGDDVSAYHLEGMPDRTEKDPNARINVRREKDKDLAFVLVDSSNGKDICTLTGTITDTPDGQKTTLAAGQACFEQDSDVASATATVTRGTATFDKTRLVLDMTLAFELRLGDEEHAGTLDYHFDGTKR
jgi:hypothetical protein